MPPPDHGTRSPDAPPPDSSGGTGDGPHRDRSDDSQPPKAPVQRTRAGAAWVGLTAATILAVALIVFIAQNTRGVEISFLWMSGNTSLALTLLIAVVSGVLLTVVLGTARIVQLRRQLRRRRG